MLLGSECSNCGFVLSDISKPIIEPYTFKLKRFFGLLGSKKSTIDNNDITEDWLSNNKFKNCDGLTENDCFQRLYLSGGSDYHGKVKNIELGTLNAECKCVTLGGLTILRAFGISKYDTP